MEKGIMSQVPLLNPIQLKRRFPVVFEVFWFKSRPKPPKAPQKQRESLHEVFTRKGLKCLCVECRNKKSALSSSG